MQIVSTSKPKIMGAKGSTPRNVLIENDSPLTVIDVSDAVVDRLKGLHSRDTAQQREHDRKVAEAAVAKARIEWEKEFLQSQKQSRIQVIAAPTAASASTPAKTIIESGPSITALEIRRQKEEELRKNDLYWQTRLKQQELDLKKTAAILEQEYNTTYDEVRSRFENSTPQYRLPPCKDVKAKLLECYKANGSQSLNCSNIVAEFGNCVQTHRTNLLTEKYGLAKQPVAAAS